MQTLKHRTETSVKAILLSVILLGLLSMELVSSASTLSLRERKKQIESRFKIVDEMDRAFPGSAVSPHKTKFEETLQELEAVYKTGDRKQVYKFLSITEEESVVSQKNVSDFASSKSDEMVQILSRKVLDKESLSQKKLDLDTQEKISSSFTMAKKEKESGKKYQRDKNYHLALFFFKRSLLYGVNVFSYVGEPIPAEFQGVQSVWGKEKSTTQRDPSKEILTKSE